MINSREFSKRLDKILEFYSLNASTFAEKVDVGRSSISHIMSGRNKPSLEFVLKVIETFDEVDLYWLLNGKGTFPKSDAVRPHANHKPQNPITSEVENISNELPFPETKTVQETTNNKKSLERVILLYRDGSFDTYTP